AAEPQDARVVRREDERCVPVEAVLIAGRRVQHVRRTLWLSEASGLHRRRLFGWRFGSRRPACRRAGRLPCARRSAASTSLPAAAASGSRLAGAGWRARPNALPAAGAQVVAVGVSVLRLAIDNVVVGRIDGGVEPVAASYAEPVGVHDAAA